MRAGKYIADRENADSLAGNANLKVHKDGIRVFGHRELRAIRPRKLRAMPLSFATL